MSNDYYNDTNAPGALTRGSSATMRSEFALVQSGFEKLPALAQVWGGNQNYAVASGPPDAWTANIASLYLTSYQDGMQVRVQFTQPNATTTPTLNLNSLGAKTIAGEDGRVLIIGGLAVNMIATLTYNLARDQWQITDSTRVSDAGMASLAASGGAALVGTIAAGTGAVARTVQDKQRDWVNARDFGAKIDGTTNDLPALNAAVSALFAAGGGKLFIPKGYCRITGTWNIGNPEYTGYSFIVTRTAPLADADYTANTISANHTANLLLPSIDIEFEEGAFLVADFTPASPTPALAYNLPFIYNNTGGSLKNPTVISAAMLSGGKYSYNAVSTPQTNNIIGIYANAGAKVIGKPFVSGCQFGLAQANGFWTQISDPFVAWAGGRCVDLSSANAVTASNITMFDSTKGLVFDGSASNLSGIHTENVAQDMTIFAADCCEFGPGYLEDTSTADGTGTYAVTLGTTSNGVQVVHSMLKGIRVGAARPNKGAYRIWALSNTTLEACRALSKTVTVDTNSFGKLIYCDFSTAAPIAKFSTDGAWAAANPPGTNYTVQGPWLFNAANLAPGSIAAGGYVNVDYALPASMNFVNSLTASASYTSGGNPVLIVNTRALFTTPRAVRFTFANPTAAAIDPGTFSMALSVVAGA